MTIDVTSEWLLDQCLTLLAGILIGYCWNQWTRKCKDPIVMSFNKCSTEDEYNNNNNNNNVKLVTLKHPEELYEALPFLKLDHSSRHNCENSDNNEIEYYLSKIKEFSVNTNHKFFLNQLFGPSDDVTVKCDTYLAEMNTSVYTYETAPVLTLIEHEVVRYFKDLLGWSDSGDGIFLPGGSLSNLMALHLARYKKRSSSQCSTNDIYEEKKNDLGYSALYSNIVLVSSEAHYSFFKSANITNLNLILVKVDIFGRMDTNHLKSLCNDYGDQIVAICATSGSTVIGAFDNLNDIYEVVNKVYQGYNRRPWLHCDGAWGGNVIFSDKYRYLVDGVSNFDSFTLNAHKMLGATQQCTLFLTRHMSILNEANGCRAEYLFSNRKVGASYDLGDKTFTCGRRGDALKYWALLKCHGAVKLGQRVDHSAFLVQTFIELITSSGPRDNILLACPPQPFNLNFYYIPDRLVPRITQFTNSKGINDLNAKILNGELIMYSKSIARDIDEIQIQLKLKLHAAGEVLLPYQPITCNIANDASSPLKDTGFHHSNDTIHCLRLVFAGMREQRQTNGFCTSSRDIENLFDLLHKYGRTV